MFIKILELGVCYLPSAVAVNVIINDSSPALFAIREPPPPLRCRVHDESRATADNPFAVVFHCNDINQALANTNRRRRPDQWQGKHVERI